MPKKEQPIVYHDGDIDRERILGKTVAVIGYGAQGRAQALNLRDSGVEVVVGLREDSRTRDPAMNDGFSSIKIEDAAKRAQIIAILVPDEKQGEVFEGSIRKNLSPGDAVIFAHGYSVHFGEIFPPKKQDVVLVAPMGPGAELRRLYLESGGLNAKIAVENDYSGEAWMIALSYAGALGCGRAGVVFTSFAEETELDLFSEQAVLCGGVPALAQAAFEVLVEAGYPPEIAYIECVREIKYIADLMYEYGLRGMQERISTTALFGGVTRGEKIITEETRNALRKIIREIKNGAFASEFKKARISREELYERTGDELIEEARRKFENGFLRNENEIIDNDD
ncbi:MAG: ketol-acid reductoisomerase [bacterium]|nr:ketol-acid reductoisomerase [bacterium]